MFVLYKAKISGERLQDHWSSGLYEVLENYHLCEILLSLEIKQRKITIIKFL